MPTKVTEKNFASRNRKRQSQFRRQQLIQATIDCIDQLGLSQTTLAQIAARAGLSQGNVVFHFHSKDELLEQTLQFLNREYQSHWQCALATAGDSSAAQLRAILSAAFAPQVCTRKKISVWFAFWGESRSRPQYMKICGDSDSAFSAKLLQLCHAVEREHGARLSAATAALSLEGMIDGLWQNFLIGEFGLKRQQAVQAVFELLDSMYPGLPPIESTADVIIN